ncbi:hypothetical protein SDRG_06912 [Saprolegnia diclina VS20]|uniref:Uncharacterized protein n=1 Tax=Saprolegnia diclina (strain VS20) TaxID=1156394 RepID=T0RT55_SAPDV|nr:hypothetical protein SDRG_06912 [Saprolegnia diclina VS20]EQC35628.1 hypothetical protein SDRG_06912 [Saprolegnia diclina VS20]|eukprot:XP_008610945.1 hypothetical protein SDRG_06912 [Saprolegnia diclina VS20]
MYASWVVGIALSLAASLFGTVGKVLMKLAHIHDGSFLLLGSATFCVLVLNPVFDAWSFAFAAQSVLAPMAGFSVVWNIVLAPYILKETLSPQVLHGSLLIIIGCGIVGLSGSHISPTHTPEELFSLFSELPFIVYAVISIVLMIMLAYVIQTYPTHSSWRRFAFGALSGLIGGNLFFTKTAVELIGKGSEIWACTETYFIVLFALGCPALGIYVLNLGLKEYDALHIVAIYESFLILCGSISGVIFFHEDEGMQEWWQQVLYPISIVTTIAGVVVLSKQSSPDSPIGEKAPLMHSAKPVKLVVQSV